ncbi:MAG: sensor histidine kinase [Bacillota bacterium]
MRINRIAFKLWANIVLMTVCLLFFIMIFQTQFLSYFHYEQEKALLRASAERIAKSYAVNPFYFMAPTAEAIRKPTDIIIITDDNYRITDISPNSGYTKGMSYGRAFLSEIKEGKVIYRENRMINNLRSLMVGVPIYKSFGQIQDVLVDESIDDSDRVYNIVGAVYVVTEISYLQPTINAIRQMFLFIFVGAIIVATAISYFLSKSFSKPLIMINNAAKEISRGNYNTTIDFNSSDEIKALGVTINNLAKQLSRVEQIRREFIANVSHEIRTPLSYLQGYTEIMLDGLAETDEEREKYLSIILDESKRLRNMVNEILQLSQIEAGHIKLMITPFSIDNTIRMIIEKVSPIAVRRNISIKYNNISDEVLMCLADENRIKQVLINLLYNAIKHSFDYGNILVSLYKQSERIYVCIRDFGEGISHEDLPFIWDRYYTSSKSREEESTGLGLAIVRNIINAHNTDISVNSVKDEGTEFCFWLQSYQES